MECRIADLFIQWFGNVLEVGGARALGTIVQLHSKGN